MKWLITILLALSSTPMLASDLASQFVAPPASARPWVYWFWNNGNVNKAGITADLEAMKRAGVGGVIIMDVVERFAPPPGDADFMSAKWQELFDFAVSEAHRLGIEINMTNGPGWCGNSGPWITPELSMQKLVSTNLVVNGPTQFSRVLPKPDTDSRRWRDTFDSTVKYPDYYEDIVVLAYPVTKDGIVSPGSVQNLTAKLGADGKLNWEVPAGQWIIQRIGHTSTGSSTRPPVKGGNGLECDKLSREAMDVHFQNMMGKLIGEVGPLAGQGKALVATHIDSWEVGSQNWTAKLRDEFKQRRGYDPTPFLPDIIAPQVAGTAAGVAVGDPATVQRFQWDFAQTISELLADNYVGELARLANEHGLRLTMEGYNLPFGDEATYTQRANEPMTEFWATGAVENEKGRQMASVAHVMGEDIVGAEAFTSGDSENWKFTPATIKSLGDYEFSQGINRFVIHRYAFQPYLDRFPGSTMGPWGLHYERTQTWWEMSTAWHEYLSRCQFMLRQGKYVADLLYLRPQLPNQTYFHPDPPPPAGYKYDEISAEALMQRVTVKDGRLVLPDGMNYRLLVLPTNTRLMTPELVQKLKQLTAAGATLVGPSPTASPSLTDYPKCDQEVAALASDVWGDCDGKSVTEHSFGKGKIVWGEPLENVLKDLDAPPDFISSVKLNWIHRQGGGRQIYFVANGSGVSVEVECTFHVKGLRPELWNPETGEMTTLALYQESAGGITIPLRLEGSGSRFVVFREPSETFDPVASFTRNGQPVLASSKTPKIKILSATYGVPGDAARTRNVQSKVQALVNSGKLDFPVGSMAEGDDPAYGIVKTLTVNYTADGQPLTVSGRDPEQINLDQALVFTTGIRGDSGKTTPIKILSASYGVPGDAARTRDVLSKVEAKINNGKLDFPVTDMAEGDDPAYGVVKTLTVNYTANGLPFVVSARDQEDIDLHQSSGFNQEGPDDFPGLIGEYFSNRNFEGSPVVTRIDPEINFSWDSGSPMPGIPAENWSARWNGFLTPLKSGEYTFCIYADDGCRLFIDGKNVIEHWDLDTGTTPHFGKVNLVAGKKYPIRIEYFQGPGNESLHLSWQVPAPPRPAEIVCAHEGGLKLVAAQAGRYELTRASGKTESVEIEDVPPSNEISGPWTVEFPPKWGAPAEITLDHLMSLSDSPIDGVKFFSGTATYEKTFDWQPAKNMESQNSEYWLDLGDVQVMARVSLNGHDLGVLWKQPFRVNITEALKPGQNHLQIQVADLWPNRMIGDAALPESKRFTWSSYEPFKANSPLPESGLIGPVEIITEEIHDLR